MQELLKDYSLIIIICLSVLSLILLIIVLVDQLYLKKQLYEKIKEQDCELRELRKWKAIYLELKEQEKRRRQGIFQQQEHRPLYKNQQVVTNNTTIISPKKTLGKDSYETSYTPSMSNRWEQKTYTYHYLQEANCGKFMKLCPSPDKCFFRTWEEGGARKFEFYGNVDRALANINAIFDDACDIEGKHSGASDIENISAGTLDSELRIISKAKIRLK